MENAQFNTFGQDPETVFSDPFVTRVCGGEEPLDQEHQDSVMEAQFNRFGKDPETLFSDPSISRVCGWKEPLDQEHKDSAMEEDDETLVDSTLCNLGSSLVPNGFMKPNCTEEVLLFVNAGGVTSMEVESNMTFMADNFFHGGDVFQTEEHITEGGDFPFIYQSARLGNFDYRFNNLPPGKYYVDLHFVEIINTYGPKGMRVFNVYMQDEKVLSDFDIFSIVGANKPLQLVDSRVSVKDDGVISVRFEGVNGSPMVSGICIRKAPEIPAPQVTHEYLICNNCSAAIEVPSAQKKVMKRKSTAKYEKRIQELSTQCKHKTDECYQAWMSLDAANDQLQKVRMELDNKLFQTYSLDQTVEKQAVNLMNITSRYERDKKFWTAAITNLEEKIKIMRQEHSQLSREAHECTDSIPELNKMVFAVQALVAQCEDLKVKYNEEQVKRRKLYNQVQEAKGNIRVFCRCRPLSKVEVSARHATIVDFDAAKDGELGIVSGGSTKKTFKFDRVYTPKDDQADVFSDASPMVISVLDGYNVCIFAYGQTGTGKTFTMEGTLQNRGVNYRTLEELFRIAKERSETFTYDISVSVLEVYNEHIRDLLATSPPSKKLEIKQASEGFHNVPGIVEAKVENIKEVWNVLHVGSSARAVGSNNVNEHSSRSHCMLCVMVTSKNLMNGECTKSKLWLVDLAGSERLAKTDVQGDRLKEAQNINRSLSALGDVISALAAKNSHIPYRNSKLTHLLQDSLGGDSKTLMFVQISPSEQDLSETLSSLNFATRVRGIELGPAKRQIDTSELQKMKVMLDKARQESRSKDESLRKLEDSLHSLESKASGKDQLYKTQQEKIKEIEGQLELKTALHNQSEKQLLHFSDRLKGREEICTNLQQKVKELENKLREREHLESATYQQKVKDLENKLREQVQEFESHSITLQQKVKELEGKLEEQEHNSDSLLNLKIKELEDTVKELEQQLECNRTVDSIASTRTTATTPLESKCHHVRDEITNGAEHNILRNSNSINHRMSQGSNLLKGNDSLHNVRRKRLSKNSETENISTSSLNDSKGSRQSDPPKPFSRITRTAKPLTNAQRPSSAHNKTSRDQVQGIKERDSKKRIWSR
ncbi:kinesin-like protein KIN-14R [Cornus florida]|uniref:kinesin-like protein KIN-14R n=1 Tax=Cornus florida TaxID=4283 RepID=UPI0028981AEC|nr:kinesin-like protein KIN-14R [Cornus florida]